MVASAAAAFSAAPAAASAPAANTQPSGSTTASPAPAPVTPPAPAANQNWYDGIEHAETKTWIAAKGFKDAGAVAESAYNLEKLLGHERAGRTLVVPGENATPEEIKAFQAKLGVPADAKEYLTAIKVPEGQSPEFANEAAKWFHEAGLTPKQAAAIAEKWNAYAPGANEAAAKAAQEASVKEFAEVTAAWGKDAEMNIELGKRAASMFVPGKDAAEKGAMLEKLESAMGTRAMLEFFANVGKNLGEHKLAGGGDAPTSGSASVAEAQATLARFMGDPTWVKDYATNKTKQAEVQKLNLIITGQKSFDPRAQ